MDPTSTRGASQDQHQYDAQRVRPFQSPNMPVAPRGAEPVRVAASHAAANTSPYDTCATGVFRAAPPPSFPPYDASVGGGAAPTYYEGTTSASAAYHTSMQGHPPPMPPIFAPPQLPLQGYSVGGGTGGLGGGTGGGMFGAMGGGGGGPNIPCYYAAPHPPQPPSAAADQRPQVEGGEWAQSLMLQSAQRQQRQHQHEHGALSASVDRSLKPGEMDAKVGLLPGIRPAYLDKYQPTNEKQRRAQRETLDTLTEEEKQERRKERARMYSHLARRRQEEHVRELIGIVEQLTVYRLMVEEASVYIVIVSPNAQAAILFANAPFAARLQLDLTQHLLGQPLLALVHPLDQDKTRVALYTVSMDHAAKRRVCCRIRGVAMSISMTHGSQGVVCILEETEIGEEEGREKRGEVGSEEAQVEEEEGSEGEVATTEGRRGGGKASGGGGGGEREKRGGEGGGGDGPQKGWWTVEGGVKKSSRARAFG